MATLRVATIATVLAVVHGSALLFESFQNEELKLNSPGKYAVMFCLFVCLFVFLFVFEIEFVIRFKTVYHSDLQSLIS